MERQFNENYPYDYATRAYCGFNITPAADPATALMLPNCGAQGDFHQTDAIPPDAEITSISATGPRSSMAAMATGGREAAFCRPTMAQAQAAHFSVVDMMGGIFRAAAVDREHRYGTGTDRNAHCR